MIELNPHHKSSGSTAVSGHSLNGWRARYYDFGNSLFGVSLVTRRHLQLISMSPGQSLLDVGCGTGEVIHRLHRKFGGTVRLCGIDPSEDILEVARRKLRDAGNITLGVGKSEQLSFPDEHFDWVVSSLTFHHLPRHLRRRSLTEIHRVLKPGGSLLVTDFGVPVNVMGRMFGKIWAGHSFTSDNLADGLEDLILAQGFTDLNVSVQAGAMYHTLVRKATNKLAPATRH